MNRFSDEVRIIPPVAWIIAVLVEFCMFCLLLFVAMPNDPKLRLWPFAGQVAFAFWPGLLVGAVVLLVGYINADARRRGMRYVMWTWLALLIPNSIGIILYFVMRDPLPVPCPKCGAAGRPGFAFCPQCGAEMARACPSCKRAVDASWNRCAYCGSALGQAGPTTPPIVGA
ncbi:MAG: zinc ribbon domain-containing protein [Acidobacteriia bacterium]|nr:zinc ribbon domain-containing protein [Terriglobia bacterium]